jgi:hypothetical protein
MNPCWLINLSMAFDGSRYLNGAAATSAVRDDDRFVIDASPLGRDIDATAPEFLHLARSRGLARLVLMAAGDPAPLRPDRVQLQVGEFVLVAPEQQLAWHLGDTWVRGQRGETSRRSSFETVALPRGDQLSTPAASARLGALLEPFVDHPDERHLVRQCLALLDGADVDDDPFGIRPWGVDDARQRLYRATMHLSAGKLSGMGGFDDRVPVNGAELVDTVVQALAAATRTD